MKTTATSNSAGTTSHTIDEGAARRTASHLRAAAGAVAGAKLTTGCGRRLGRGPFGPLGADVGQVLAPPLVVEEADALVPVLLLGREPWPDLLVDELGCALARRRVAREERHLGLVLRVERGLDVL